MTSRTLVRALARVGLEPAGPLGAGATGPRLVARDADGRGWAVTLVGPEEMPRAALRARVAALAGSAHPHLATVAPLLELRDGTAVALQAEVVGPDLATVVRARGPWRAGEVVTLVVPLAQALATLHRAGVAHGDVAPGNVVLERDGRPVLVDLVCGARTAELGTPGLAAPERVHGAQPPGDVHALARLGLALLAADGADEAAAPPDPGAAPLRAVLEAATATEPSARPDAAELARLAYAACTPEPVLLPDPAVLARLTLRRLAAPPTAATEVRPDLAPDRRRARHRRARPLRGPAVAAAVGLALVGLVAAERLGGSPAGPAEPVAVDVALVARAGDAGVGWGVDAALAAARLTARRAEALGERDAARLRAVSVPGSRAAIADMRLAGTLWGATLRGAAPSGGGADVEAVHLLSLVPPGPALPWRARVLVRARAWVSAGESSTAPDAPDAPDADGGAAPAGAVVLVLDRCRAGWRVSAVEPSPAA